jgi:hypothetical protein
MSILLKEIAPFIDDTDEVEKLFSKKIEEIAKKTTYEEFSVIVNKFNLNIESICSKKFSNYFHAILHNPNKTDEEIIEKLTEIKNKNNVDTDYFIPYLLKWDYNRPKLIEKFCNKMLMTMQCLMSIPYHILSDKFDKIAACKIIVTSVFDRPPFVNVLEMHLQIYGFMYFKKTLDFLDEIFDQNERYIEDFKEIREKINITRQKMKDKKKQNKVKLIEEIDELRQALTVENDRYVHIETERNILVAENKDLHLKVNKLKNKIEVEVDINTQKNDNNDHLTTIRSTGDVDIKDSIKKFINSGEDKEAKIQEVILMLLDGGL